MTAEETCFEPVRTFILFLTLRLTMLLIKWNYLLKDLT